jgi:hypothetical protein
MLGIYPKNISVVFVFGGFAAKQKHHTHGEVP